MLQNQNERDQAGRRQPPTANLLWRSLGND